MLGGKRKSRRKRAGYATKKKMKSFGVELSGFVVTVLARAIRVCTSLNDTPVVSRFYEFTRSLSMQGKKIRFMLYHRTMDEATTVPLMAVRVDHPC